MAEVLVLVDHANGEVKKPAAEMLTIARRLGEPSAVFIGPGAETATDLLARYGARRSTPSPTRPRSSTSSPPQAEILAQLVQEKQPAAVLIRAAPPARRSVRAWPSRPSRV